jgi:methylated-DNA-[protein]-cysteine S-methyltransferase
MIHRASFSTPFGRMQIGVDDAGTLVELRLPNRSSEGDTELPVSERARRGLNAALAQLAEYFAGTRRDFDLPLDPHGSEFERAVWQRLRAIPYGVTISYGAIADELALVNGARAVGRANGANPIAIVIPCHRVIGSDGTLTGYGGGLPLKRALLEFEGAIAPLAPSLFDG